MSTNKSNVDVLFGYEFKLFFDKGILKKHYFYYFFSSTSGWKPQIKTTFKVFSSRLTNIGWLLQFDLFGQYLY